MTLDLQHVVRDFQRMSKDEQREHLREHGIEPDEEDTRRGPSRYYGQHVEAHAEDPCEYGHKPGRGPEWRRCVRCGEVLRG